MSRRYVFSVPVGPGHHDRLTHTLASLKAQPVDVAVALCHAGQEADIDALVAPYRNLIAHERHGPDAGQSAAINEGWNAVDGDVYGWLNADDTLAPQALGKVDELFDREPGADTVCGQSLIEDDAGRFTGLHPAVKAPDRDLFRSNIISQPSCFMRRDALFEAGLLEEELHYAMDWNLWVRLMERGKTFAYTPDILSSVLWGQDTKTASLGLARIREIRSVVARQRSPVTTAKTLFGFTVHHLSEYSAVSAPVRGVRSLIRSGRMAPLSFWGEDDDQGVSLPLFHYRSTPASAVRIDLQMPGERWLEIAGQTIDASGTSVTANVILPPAESVEMRIAGPGFSPADIASIEFV